MRNLSSWVAVASVATVAAVATPAQAQTSFFAIINGASEVPATGSPGSGIASLNIINATTIAVNLQVSGLGSNIQTSGADGHIHISNGGATANGGVFVSLFGNQGFTGTITGGPGFNFVTIQGQYTGNAGTQNVAAVVTALQDGNAQTLPYFNFHTTTFPAGEVRGNIQVAPEPASLSLIGLVALGGVIVRRRFRK